MKAIALWPVKAVLLSYLSLSKTICAMDKSSKKAKRFYSSIVKPKLTQVFYSILSLF